MTPSAVADVVVVDHHDSYTWSLVHLVASVTGRLPALVQHDSVSVAEVLSYSHVVLSPGPGHPSVVSDFAVGAEVLRAATRPVLGVCLGMQGLVTTYGGSVSRVEPAHGRVSAVAHTDVGVLAGLPQGFEVVRYHSLAATSVPSCLEVTATAEDDGAVMAVRHRELPLEGVQFHPESVLTQHGRHVIERFLSWTS